MPKRDATDTPKRPRGPKRIALPDSPAVHEARELGVRMRVFENELERARRDRDALIPRLRQDGCTWEAIAELFGVTDRRLGQIVGQLKRELDEELFARRKAS